MQVTKIRSLDLVALEPYRTMRRTMEHCAKGIFVAEGEKVVHRLIRSNLQIVSILLTQDWLDKYSSILASHQVEEGIFVGEKSLLEQIVGYRLHQGIMAVAKVGESPDILEFARSCPVPKLLVAVDGIANSENMGVIVRNCAAFGVQVLMVGETSCDPFLRRSVRNSMGTIFGLPISRVGTLSESLNRLNSELSIQIVAADPKNESVDISKVDLTKDICIVFGSEGEGISPDVLGRCNVRMKIPMHGGIDSINVATSVGVILYETIRQRSSRRVG